MHSFFLQFVLLVLFHVLLERLINEIWQVLLGPLDYLLDLVFTHPLNIHLLRQFPFLTASTLLLFLISAHLSARAQQIFPRGQIRFLLRL